MDGWRPLEFKWLSNRALAMLAELLRAVELGAEWPTHALHARVAFLAKTDQANFAIEQYRLLSVLAVLYRVWAGTRCFQCRGWVESWVEPGTHAGVRGASAESAWLQTALIMEKARVDGESHMMGTTDVWKYFDQVSRGLLYTMLVFSGFPPAVTRAYAAYVEHVQFYNSMAMGLGTAYPRRMSIPQGCPLSMAFATLLLTPWLRAIRSMNAIPRMLADGLFVYCQGRCVPQIRARA